jgi:hypothetical protein
MADPAAAPTRPKRGILSRGSSFLGNGTGEVGERPDWMTGFVLLGTLLPLTSLGLCNPAVRDKLTKTHTYLSLEDIIETFFDSRLDLIERKLKVHSDRLKNNISKNLECVPCPFSAALPLPNSL